MKEWIKRFSSRQFFGLVLTAAIYFWGKNQPDWVWFSCFAVYVLGNQVQKNIPALLEIAKNKIK